MVNDNLFKYDPQYATPFRVRIEYKGDIGAMTKKILHTLIVKRIRNDKPCVICVVGKSGEGKSATVLSISDAIFELEGLDFSKYVKNCVIMSATEFGPKTRAMLREAFLKEVFILIIDEAKSTVNALDWQTAVNRTISMVNSLSREIKPMAIFVIAQSLRDVDRATKETIDFYVKVTRDQKVHAKIYEFYVDDHDLDKPKMKKRFVKVLVKDENGNYRPYILKKINFKKTRKEVWDEYKKIVHESKDKLIEQEFDKLDKFLQEKYTNKEMERVIKLAQYMADNPDKTKEYGIFKYRKWKLSSIIADHFNLTPSQSRLLEQQMTQLFKAKSEKIGLAEGVFNDAPIEQATGRI